MFLSYYLFGFSASPFHNCAARPPANAMAGSVSAAVSALPGDAVTAAVAPSAARTPARPRVKRLTDAQKAALAKHRLASWNASIPSVAVGVDLAALAQAAACTAAQAGY